jgi:hypothetical protein
LVTIPPVLVLLERNGRLKVHPGENLFENFKWLSDEILVAQSYVSIGMEKSEQLACKIGNDPTPSRAQGSRSS